MTEGGKMESALAAVQHVTRPLVTFLFAATFCVGFFLGMIGGDVFTQTATVVVTWWFAQRGADVRAEDRAKTPPGATATAPAAGGTATATVIPSPPKGE